MKGKHLENSGVPASRLAESIMVPIWYAEMQLLNPLFVLQATCSSKPEGKHGALCSLPQRAMSACLPTSWVLSGAESTVLEKRNSGKELLVAEAFHPPSYCTMLLWALVQRQNTPRHRLIFYSSSFWVQKEWPSASVCNRKLVYCDTQQTGIICSKSVRYGVLLHFRNMKIDQNHTYNSRDVNLQACLWGPKYPGKQQGHLLKWSRKFFKKACVLRSCHLHQS